ncbi:MAG: hypothetical protein JNM27_10215 [Leptospirales bacterium]|nr:hypothetical protein [Leptospirales bacterium]
MSASRFLLFTALLILTGFSVFSQAPTSQPVSTQPEGQPATQPAGNAQAIQLQDFDPIAVKDPRFVVTNVNFDRRYAPNGIGEFLDVVFDLKNLTSEPVEFYAYVLAFWETDSVDNNTRRMIPYPSWRVNDPARGEYLVHYITVTPKDIEEKEIWSDKDPDFKHYSHIIDRMRDSVATTEPVSDVRPPYWKYLSYISQRPAQGLKFKLYGEKGPGQHETIQTNYIPPTAEEKKLKVHRTLPQHKFTIENNRRATIFRSHHYSAYRADFRFFNMVSIVLFDAKQADAYEEQKKAGGPKAGEAKINPLVYKQTFRIARPLRM